MPRAPRFAFVSAAVLAIASPALAMPFFSGLGALAPLGANAPSSGATAVTADGSAVFGVSASFTIQPGNAPEPSIGDIPFRWSAATGIVPIEEACFDGGGLLCDAVITDVAVDGSAVGLASNGDGNASQPLLWNPSGVFTSLTGIAGEFEQALGVSESGSRIVGVTGADLDYQATIWDAPDDPVQLGVLPGSEFSIAHAISADGAIVVGTSGSWGPGAPGFRLMNAIPAQAFIWTASDGMLALEDPSSSDQMRAALAISGDGSTIAGVGPTAGGPMLFVFTASGGLEPIAAGTLIAHDLDRALAISADGSVIVGGLQGVGAFVWDRDHGLRDLASVLEELGLDLTGWQLGSAWDVSADGLTIVGTGVDPDGNVESWVAFIPEPATGLLLGVGIAGLAARRRSRASSSSAPLPQR